MAFSKSKLKRFNEISAETPPVGSYDPKLVDSASTVSISKSERFKHLADTSSASSCQEESFKIPNTVSKGRCTSVSAANEKIQQLEKEIKRLIHEKTIYSKEKVQKEEEFRKLSSKLNAALHSKTHLLSLLATRDREIKDMRKSLDILKTKVNTLENTTYKKKDLQCDLAKALGNLVEKEHDLKDAKLQIQKLEANLKKLQELLEKEKNRKTKLDLIEETKDFHEQLSSVLLESDSDKNSPTNLSQLSYQFEDESDCPSSERNVSNLEDDLGIEINKEPLLQECQTALADQELQKKDLNQEEINALSVELDQLKQDINNYKITAEAAKEKEMEFIAKLDEASETIKLLKLDIDKKETAVEEHETHKASLHLEIEKLKANIKEKEEECLHVKENLNVLVDKIQLDQEILNEKEEHINTITAEVDKVKQENNNYKVTAEAAKEKEAELLQKLNDASLTIEKQKIDNSEKIAAIDEYEVQKASLQREIEELRTKMKEKDIECLQNKECLSILEDEAQLHKEKLNEKENKLIAISAELEQQKQEFTEKETGLLQKLNETSEIIEKLHSDNEKSKIENEALQVTLQAEIEQLKINVKDKEGEYLHVKKCLNILEDQIELSQKKVNEKEEYIDRMSAEVERLKQDNNDFRIIVEAAKEKEKELSENLEKASQAIKSQQSEILEKISAIEEYEILKANLETELQELKLKIKEKEIECLHNKECLTTLEDQAVFLTKNLNEKEELLLSMSAEMQQLKQYNDNYKVDIEAANKKETELMLKLNEALQTIDRLQVDSLEKKSEFEVKETSLQNEIKHLNANMKEIEAECLQNKKCMTVLEDQAELHKRNLKEKEQQLVNVLAQIEQQNKAIKEREVAFLLELNEALETIKRLKADVAEKTTAIQEHQTFEVTLQNKCHHSEDIIRDLQLQLKERENEITSLEYQRSEQENEVSILKAKNTQYWNDLEMKRNQLEELQNTTKSIEDQQRMMFHMKQENENLRRELMDKVTELNRISSLYKNLCQRIEPFQEQLDMFEAERCALLNRNRESKHEIEELSQRYALLLGHQNQKQKIRHMIKLKEDNLYIKEENAKLRQECAKHQRHISRLKDELDSHLGRRRFDPSKAFKHHTNKENSVPLYEGQRN